MIQRLKKVDHYGPVTAVAFVSNGILLVGQGPILKKYDWRSGHLLDQKKIFSKNKIHGISWTGTDKVAIWGGRSLVLLDTQTFNLLNVGERCLNEWIVHVTWTFDLSRLVIQTAHNSIISVDTESDFKVVSIDGCSENSILYSGTICPLEDRTLVAAGTVLGGVVTWCLETNEIIHNMTSHEGSIFYVRFSPSGKYLASCSDDRCIKLWDVETGQELATGWGHMARIWSLHFLNEHTLVSTSEDCTSRLWSYKLESDKLECLKVLEGHRGRSVWCGSISYEDSVFVSGGADGQVLLFDLQDSLENENVISLKLDSLEDNENLEKNETFKKFARLGQLLIVTTTTGRAFVANIARAGQKTEEVEWTKITGVPRDVFTMIEAFPEIASVCIGVRDGTLTVVEFNDIQNAVNHRIKHFKVDSITGKVCSIHGFSIESGLHYIMAESQRQDDDFLLVNISGNGPTMSLARPATFTVESVGFDKLNCRLFVGSKHGAVAFYDLSVLLKSGDISASTPSLEYVSCWRRLMSMEPITSITVMPRTQTPNSELKDISSLVVTGSDGKLMFISVSSNGSYDRIMTDRIPKGSIEGSRVIEREGAEALLYLAAFKQDQFFLFNYNDQISVFSQKCGGAHREWGLITGASVDDNDQIEFSYFKTGEFHSRMSYSHKNKFSKRVLQSGVHGQEIRAIALSPCKAVVNGQESFILATSSEDTTIRLSTFYPGDKTASSAVLTTWSSQRKHISGIPQLSWTPDGKFMISCSAQEQLTVWKISVLDGKVFATPFVNLPTSTSLPDLRTMAFTFFYDYPSEGLLLLASVYSDSTMKLWTIDMKTEDCKLLQEWRYTGCCLLNCDFVQHGDRLYLAVSSTDGYLVLWDVSSFVEEPVQILKLQLHQSSVKSSFVTEVGNIEGGGYYHFSVGDDNALSVAHLDLQAPSSSKLLMSKPDAHSCTITAIKLLNSGDNSDSVVFATTGTDQNVRLWSYQRESGELRLVDSAYTTVADTGCLETTCWGGDSKSLLFIGGAGLSYWQVDSSSGL